MTPQTFQKFLQKHKLCAKTHHLVFQDEIIYCNACNLRISSSNCKRHCKGAKHKQKCVQRNKLVTRSRQTLMTLKTFEEQNPDAQGQSLDDETKMLRLEFVKLLADCNISAEKGEFIKEFFHNHSKSNCNLGPQRTTSDYFHHVEEGFAAAAIIWPL